MSKLHDAAVVRLDGKAVVRLGGQIGVVGGAERDRTADLCSAIAALSQLSYGPSEECMVEPTGIEPVTS